MPTVILIGTLDTKGRRSSRSFFCGMSWRSFAGSRGGRSFGL
jgi:hypothetical protein